MPIMEGVTKVGHTKRRKKKPPIDVLTAFGNFRDTDSFTKNKIVSTSLDTKLEKKKNEKYVGMEGRERVMRSTK